MDYEWQPEQLNKITAIEQFADEFFKDRPRSKTFDRQAWDACAAQGLFKIPLPEQNWGGNDEGLLLTTGLLEALGRKGADPSLLFSMGAHLFGCVIPVAWFASDEMQTEYGNKLATGQAIGALAITEPQGGSNLSNLKTSAEKQSGGYVLNGEKTLISNAPIADVFFVLAASKPEGGIFGLSAFLLPKDTPGFSVEEQNDTLGLQASPMGIVRMDNCIVPDSALMGTLHSGFTVFSKAMLWERTGLLSGFLGVAQRDIDNCIRFLNERQDENGALANHQSLYHRVAKMQLRIESALMLIYRAAWAVDTGKKDAHKKASIAKYTASEALLQNAIDSMRIHAGTGWSDSQGTASVLRDFVGTLFASGTSEVQLNLIAATLGLKR